MTAHNGEKPYQGHSTILGRTLRHIPAIFRSFIDFEEKLKVAHFLTPLSPFTTMFHLYKYLKNFRSY